MSNKLVTVANEEISIEVLGIEKGGRKPNGFIVPPKYQLRFVDYDDKKLDLVRPGQQYILVIDNKPIRVEVIDIALDVIHAWAI